MIITFLHRVALISTVVTLCLSSTINSNAQVSDSSLTLTERVDSLDELLPGWEDFVGSSFEKQYPGWKRDALGNLILHKGSGSPRRVVACAFDLPPFAVTQIAGDGFLRLREAGGGRTHPLWVQFHEGQRIRIYTRGGIVPGVVTVKSTHLQRGRVPNAPPTTLDDLWVDVGATSREDVERLGIKMLDPVARDFRSWVYADYVAGSSAASRVGCAAVLNASSGTVASGETIFVIATLRNFGQDGLAAALHSLGQVDEITLVDEPIDNQKETGVRKVDKPAYLPQSTQLSSLSILSPKVKFPRTLVESVAKGDVQELFSAAAKAAGVTLGQPLTAPNSSAPPKARIDSFSETATVLTSLADTYSVSGHEAPVREKILSALPDWARQKATTDNEGNLIVEVGPDRDPVMFIAHQDEVGFEITNIANDGTVSLRTRGGMFQSLWEGQTALLHFDQPGKEPLRGVFVPRDTATTKQPESTTAWFGVDGAALKRLGVVTGLSVTSFKRATRLGPTRFTARALDDRAGSTALILAARNINPALLKHKLILAWSVREETGLEGAITLAKKYASSVKRVYSIDTFVSSDSPAESQRFAFAPLGEGAVIRGLDNSAVATPSEIDRIVSLARLNRIPLQVGATNGGTDGSEFVPYGAVHVSLSWPGRYSHSPVEVLDLRDLAALAKLLTVLAM